MALSYYHKLPSKPLDYCTYWNMLDEHCAGNPDKEAVVFYDNDKCSYRATFGQLQETTWNYAARLLEKFPWLQMSDRIAVVGSNRPEVMLVELTCYRIGNAVMFPPTGMKGGADLSQALNFTGCKILFFETDYVEKNTLHILFEMIPSLKHAVVYGPEAEGYVSSKVTIWECLFSRDYLPPIDVKTAAKERFLNISPDSDAVAYFTSGTTGKPKAVLWSHFGLVNSQISFAERSYCNKNTRFLQDRPMTNLAGSMFTSRLIGVVGATIVVVKLAITLNVTDPETIYDIIEKEHITNTLLFGYMLHDFVTSRTDIAKKLSGLRYAIVGGQVINQDHAALLKDLLPNLHLVEGYGATEMSAVVVQEPHTTPGFIGRPVDNNESKVIDHEGKIVPVGEIGELCFRNPKMMVGYISEDGLLPGKDIYGWYHTDDSAIMNEKGEIKAMGRMSDVIKRATILVVPAVIEAVLAEHPKIQGVQVVGVPDPRLYQDICACIVPHDPPPTETEIQDWCEEKFKVHHKTGMKLYPKYFMFMKEFPRAASTKIDRRQLWKMAEEFVYGKQ